MDLLIPRGAGGVDQRRTLPLAQAAATLLPPSGPSRWPLAFWTGP